MRRLIPANVFLCFAVVAGLLVLSGDALAHHGTPAYEEKLVELKGASVTRFKWANPHSLIYFDAKDDSGKVTHWVIEIGPPPAMQALGWTKTSLKPGDVLTVHFYPAKSGNPVGRLSHIVLADGTELHDSRLGGGRRPQ
jgi:hypothetical protein